MSSAPPVQAAPESAPKPGGRRPVRFGVASRVTLTLVALVALTVLVAGFSLWGIDQFRQGFDHIALERHRQLTSVARLAQRAEAVAVTAPRLITARDRFDLQRQEQYLNDQLTLIKAAFDDTHALGIDPTVMAEMDAHREAMVENLRQIIVVVEQRIAVAEDIATHLKAIDKAFEASRPLREGSEDGSRVLRRTLELMDHAHATLLQSLTEPYVSGVRGRERETSATLANAFAQIQKTSDAEWDGLIVLWQAVKDRADGPGGLLPLRRQQLELALTNQGLLIRNNVLSGRFSASATNLFTDMEADIDRERVAFADLMDVGIALLLAAVAASVIGALAALMFLRRRVIDRLTGLQQTMHARAEGRPVPIPTAGNDEISDMAHSLAFFVNEIERREDALSEARDEALELARDMNKKGQLTEGVIYDAIGRKDRNMAMAALAVLSDTKMAAVVKAFATNSAKGIVALVWEAGCSPKLAVDLQQGLGNVAPVEIIRPSSKAAYGLSEAEMSWQLEFLRDMA